MELYEPPWNEMKQNETLWNIMKLYETPWNRRHYETPLKNLNIWNSTMHTKIINCVHYVTPSGIMHHSETLLILNPLTKHRTPNKPNMQCQHVSNTYLSCNVFTPQLMLALCTYLFTTIQLSRDHILRQHGDCTCSTPHSCPMACITWGGVGPCVIRYLCVIFSSFKYKIFTAVCLATWCIAQGRAGIGYKDRCWPSALCYHNRGLVQLATLQGCDVISFSINRCIMYWGNYQKNIHLIICKSTAKATRVYVHMFF